MNNRIPFTALLIVLISILIDPGACTAGDPDHLTILYTSDELGYLEPCG
jgi:hypothetical protein